MKVKGSVIPPVPFSVEQQPKKPDMALVRFYENVEPYTEEIDGMTSSGYIYDEYHLELTWYPALAVDIEGNFDVYFEQAKLTEEETPEAKQREADKREAQLVYTAIMTDTLLPEEDEDDV